MSSKDTEIVAQPEDDTVTDYSEFFDDETEEILVPKVTDIVKNHKVTRDKARDIVEALRREAEKEAELVSPSGDEHLDKIINAPILEAIKCLSDDNVKLSERMRTGGLYEDDGVTPAQAREMYRANIKTLVELKGSLSAGVKQAGGGTSIHMDLGSVFHEALSAAREVDVSAEIIQ